MGKHKFDFFDTEFGKFLKAQRVLTNRAKKGNPPGTKIGSKKRKHAINWPKFDGRLTQLNDGKIVPQKKSLRVS
jgi:hypothetical protein